MIVDFDAVQKGSTTVDAACPSTALARRSATESPLVQTPPNV